MSRLDQTAAERILMSNRIVTVGINTNVRVSNISYKDKEGNPFLWEETEEPYAIANFQAMNEYGAEQAEALFAEEKYDEAVNTNLSARISYEVAEELAKTMRASLELEPRQLKDGSTAELIRKVIPAVPNAVRQFSFAKKEQPVEPQPAGGFTV